MAAILELDEHLNKSFKVNNILMYLLFFSNTNHSLHASGKEKGVCMQ